MFLKLLFILSFIQSPDNDSTDVRRVWERMVDKVLTQSHAEIAENVEREAYFYSSIREELTSSNCSNCEYLYVYTGTNDFIVANTDTSHALINLINPELKINLSHINSLDPLSIFLTIYNIENNRYIEVNDISEYVRDLPKDTNDLYSQLLHFWYHYQQDRYLEAVSSLAKTDLTKILDPFLRLRIARQLSYSQIQIGRLNDSIALIEQTILPLTENYKAQNELRRVKSDLAYSLIRIGRYNYAKSLLDELLNYKSRDEIKLFTYNNLAAIYYAEGKSALYIDFQLKAAELAIELEDYFELLKYYKNLHIFHKYNKNWATALLYIEKAEQLIEDQQFGNRELSALYRSIGDFYWESEKDLEKALFNIDYGLSLINSDDYYFDYFYNLQVKSKFLEASEFYQEAEEILLEMIDLSNSRSDQYNYLVSKIDLAYLRLKKGTKEGISETLNEIESYDISGLEFTSLVKKAYLEISLDNSSESLQNENLTSIVEQILERSKNSTLSQGGYWNLEPEYSDVFEFAADKYISTNRFADLVELFDRIKTINDVNYFNNPLITSSNLSNDDLVRVSSLNEELTRLRNKLLTSNLSNKASVQADIDLKSAQLERLRSNVTLNTSSVNVPYWNLQRVINSNQVILYFTQVKNHLYKIEITKSNYSSSKITFTAEEISKLGYITESLATKKTDLNDLYDFYQKLELSDLPNGIDEIIVIPDSYLLQVPIDILPTNKPEFSYSYGSAHYLIEDYLISYVSSIEELLQNQRYQNGAFENNFAAFGISNFDHIQTNDLVPLPFAEQEIARVGNSLNEQKKKLLISSDKATKNTFLNNAAGSKVLHLATHSEVSNEDPIYSTLYFEKDIVSQSDSSDDGTLYAYELYNLNLQSDLIFLNSCSSGSGNYLQGTGVMGINRALRYAGAKSLLLNLWPVNDNVASGFAENFYSELSKGLSKPEALRNAKLVQLREGSADPHYWGVYMLIGNPSPVFNDPGDKMKNASTYSILALILFFSISIGYRRKAS